MQMWLLSSAKLWSRGHWEGGKTVMSLLSIFSIPPPSVCRGRQRVEHPLGRAKCLWSLAAEVFLGWALLWWDGLGAPSVLQLGSLSSPSSAGPGWQPAPWEGPVAWSGQRAQTCSWIMSRWGWSHHVLIQLCVAPYDMWDVATGKWRGPCWVVGEHLLPQLVGSAAQGPAGFVLLVMGAGWDATCVAAVWIPSGELAAPGSKAVLLWASLLCTVLGHHPCLPSPAQDARGLTLIVE